MKRTLTSRAIEELGKLHTIDEAAWEKIPARLTSSKQQAWNLRKHLVVSGLVVIRRQITAKGHQLQDKSMKRFENDSRIIAAFAGGETGCAMDLARDFGIDRGTVQAALKRLCRSGVLEVARVEKNGNNRNRHFYRMAQTKVKAPAIPCSVRRSTVELALEARPALQRVFP